MAQFPPCDEDNYQFYSANAESFKAAVLYLLCKIAGAATGGTSAANYENYVYGKSGEMSDNTPHALVGMEGVAGTSIMITSFSMTNGDPDTTTYVSLQDEDGTELKRFDTSYGGGGATPTLPTPIMVPEGKGVRAINITTGADVYVFAEGYRQPL